MRLNGTFDVDYDDGEKEAGVEKSMIRALNGRNDRFNTDRFDSRIEPSANAESKSLDSKVDSTASSKDVPSRDSVDAKGVGNAITEKRIAALGQERPLGEEVLFRKGDKVACYWYRSQAYAIAKAQQRPKAAIVLRFNSDNTYTVEMELDNDIIDDVPADKLKDWAVATADLRPGAQDAPQQKLDKWLSVVVMAEKFERQGKASKNHSVPHLDDVQRITDTKEKMIAILSRDCFRDFADAFGDADKYGDGTLDVDGVLAAVKIVGGAITEADLRAWMRKISINGRLVKSFDIVEFIFAYANIFYPTNEATMKDPKHQEKEAAGKALGIDVEFRDMASFALSFGKKLLRDLERSFAFYSKLDSQNVPRMRASDIIEAFHTMGRAVTMTRLQDWMTDSDVRPQDLLSLADFATCFAFFFTPPEGRGVVGSGSARETTNFTNLTLGEVAVTTLQSERWRGTEEQVISFVRRLTAGRSEALAKTIGAIRDAFEAKLKSPEDSEVSLTDIEDIFVQAKASSPAVSLSAKKFSERLKRQGRGTFSLPELFEFFGSIVQETGEGSVSIAEAFAMMRLHYNTADVRLIADMAQKVVENILQHTDDSKYWLVNIKSEEFYAKVWMKEEGKVLMKALGFGEPYDSSGPDGKSRKVISLTALPQNVSLVTKLPATVVGALKVKRMEMESEIVALEGAPSVSAAIREIRAYHSVSETRTAVETALTFVRNVLSQPKDIRLYRAKKANPAFHRCLGRLKNSELLMHAIGFMSNSDSNGMPPNQFILQSVSTGKKTKADATFDPTVAGDVAKFKFPSLDPETERFLWRRKADLEIALRAMDGLEEGAPTGGVAAQDAAHVLGTTVKALEERSKQVRKSVEESQGKPKEAQKDAKSKAAAKDGQVSTAVPDVKSFYRGASAAQLSQLRMIEEVFKQMDADGDGLLSVSDVRAYFRTIGRNASDLITRRWIRTRDIDQDGAVSLSEFVAAFAPQLDPASKFVDAQGKLSDPAVGPSAITIAFGALKLGSTTAEALEACKAAAEYVRRVIDAPSIKSFWSIMVNDALYNKRIGRLFGGTHLMNALGFLPENNGAVLALRDPNGKSWDVVPQDVKVRLNVSLEELSSHEQALLEPTVSNIAAVSSAIGNLGDTKEKAEAWNLAMETIAVILDNIIKHPRQAKYYSINATNPNFHRRVGSVGGALSILVSLGFREDEGGSLILPLDTDVKVLEARHLEMQVGLDLIRKRIVAGKFAAVAATSVAPKSPTKKGKDSTENKENAISEANTKKKTDKVDPKLTAASAGLGADVDDAARAKDASKTHALLLNEKTLRQKAEVALNQTKAVVAELQTQLAEIQEADAKAVSLRHELTISRMGSHERAAVTKEAEALGKTIAEQQQADSVPVEAEKSKTAVTKGKVAKPDWDAETSLSKAAKIGDTKIQVEHNNGFKKGMRIFLGTGTRTEIHIVNGFGSIILDQPLQIAHPAGTPVLGFVHNTKGTQHLLAYDALQFIKGILYEEIIPQACALGARNLLDLELNEVYSSRAIYKHNYSFEAGSPIGFAGDCSSLSLSNESAQLVAAVGGNVLSVELNFGAVQFAFLFLSLLPTEAAESTLRGASIDTNDILNVFSADDNSRGAFLQIAVARGMASLQDLVAHFSKAGRLTWEAFSHMVTGCAVSVEHREAIESYEGMSPVESRSRDALLYLFDLTDTDKDETITEGEALHLFAELDGCATALDNFRTALSRTVGGTPGVESKLTDVQFLKTREEYAKLTRTMVGGVRLYGRLIVRSTLNIIRKTEAEIENRPPTPFTALMVSPNDVLSRLPDIVESALVLSERVHVSVLIASLPLSVAAPALEDVACGISRVGGLVPRSKIWPATATSDYSISQLVTDASGRRTIALSSSGVGYVFDTATGRSLCEQRLIWAEPTPSRAVEGSEKFLKWRRDSCLDGTDLTPDGALKAQDTTNISSLLSQFAIPLPEASGAAPAKTFEMLSLDEEAGLLAVNCSVVSGAITVHDQVSLRRIYRIRAPGHISNELRTAVDNISCGRTQKDRPTLRSCSGAVQSMKLWAHKSLLLCTVVGSEKVHVLSLLTGDSLIELVGHYGDVTCMATSLKNNLIFSGSADKTVRVWQASQCIPFKLAIIGGFDDPSTVDMEKRVTAVGGSLGPGSRAVLRALVTQLNSRLNLSPKWRHGRISGFFDGKKYSNTVVASAVIAGVEVVFENASVQLFHNQNALRQPREVLRAPHGPPFWGEPEVPLTHGRAVAVYDIDPEVAANACTRAAGVPSNVVFSCAELVQLLQDILHQDQVHSGEAVDIKNALTAAGIEAGVSMSLSAVIRRIYNLLGREVSQCERLLAGNIAAISAITVSEVSKLVVSMDQAGCCCVWDPIGCRANLAISDLFNRPAFIGTPAYSLVLRSNFQFELSKYPLLIGDTPAENVRVCVSDVKVLTVRDAYHSAFPVDSKALMKAYGIDAKFERENVTVRGFVYVMKDLTHRCVETSAFQPALIPLDNQSQFMYTARMLGDAAALTCLQDLYRQRRDVYRVIYAVSCSHPSMEQLAKDLNQYGVLQRGYNTTPSELIEVMCFERPAGWLEAHKSNGARVDTVIRTLTAENSGTQTRTGIVVSSTKCRNGRKYRVAMDYSNDIVSMDKSQILDVISAYSSMSSVDPTDPDEVPVGSRVTCAVSVPIKSLSGAWNEYEAGSSVASTTLAELLVVSLKVVGLGRAGQDKSVLLPVLFGRSSFPVPARSLEMPLGESVRRKLNEAYASVTLSAAGRLGAAAFQSWGQRMAWMSTHSLFTQRSLDALSTPGVEVKEKHIFDLITALSSDTLSLLHSSLDALLVFARQRVSMSHPLIGHFNGILAGMGPSLIKAQDNDDVDAWKSLLEKLQLMYIQRLGVSADELYSLGSKAGLYQHDIENFMFKLVATAQNFESGNTSALGPYDANVVAALFRRSPVSFSSGGSEGILERGSADDGYVHKLLMQHYLSIASKVHHQALVGITTDGLVVLRALLCLLVGPVIIAVKDSPYLLPLPTKAQCLQFYPVKNPVPSSGQYGVLSKSPMEFSVQGMRCDILRASRTRPDDGILHSFMAWRYRAKSEDISPIMLQAVARLPQLISPIQRDLPTVRILDGITFTAESESQGINFEWNDKWHTLYSVTQQHGGLMSKGKFELLRILGTRLLDAVSDFNDRNIGLRTLSPSTIVLDETGLSLRLLVLPTVCDIDDPDGEINLPCNEVLSAYASATSSSPVLRACLPNFGNASASNVDSHEAASKYDVWSFGMNLFVMAFGLKPLSVESLSAQPNEIETVDSVASSLLYRLMKPAFTGDARLVSASDGDVHHQSMIIAKSLQSLLDEKSKGLMYTLVSDMTGTSLTRLSRWRTSFLAEAPTAGLTEQSASALFERLCQNIFWVLRGGQAQVASLRSILAATPGDLNSETAKTFALDRLCVVLTKAEFDAFLTSLAPEVRIRPYAERAAKGFKYLASLLDEILVYGMFQQLVYIIARCLSSSPSQRPALHELRRMPFFGLSDELSLSKAAQEAALLLTPYQSTSDFFDKALRAPLCRALQNLMVPSGTVSLKVPTSTTLNATAMVTTTTHTDIEEVSKVLGVLEDLASVLNDCAAGRDDVDATHYRFLLGTGAHLRWVRASVAQIWSQCISGQILSAISLYTSRFMTSESSHSMDDNPALREAGHGSKGLSLGSRFMVRISKFFQHFINVLQAISRPLSFSHIISQQNDSTAYLSQLRVGAEALYKGTLAALTSLYLGEEASLPLTGTWSKTISHSYNQLLANDKSFKFLYSNSVWSVSMSKFFEQQLLDLVGDDGKGNSKMSISVDVLRQNDIFVPILSTLITSVGREANAADISALSFKTGTESRGTVYFVNLMRINRNLCSLDSATGKALDRSRQSICSALLTVLPSVVPPTTEEVEELCKHSLSFRGSAVILDFSALQRIQVVLDARIASRLTSFFDNSDSMVTNSLVRVCLRALSIICGASAEMRAQEPLRSLAYEFTCPAWVSALSDILRGKIVHLETTLAAAQCMRIMALNREWMRAWPTFDVLSILLHVAKAGGVQAANLRTEAKIALRMSTINRPEGARAAADMHLPGAEILPGTSGHGPVEELLAEAQDMQFGSTLQEQEHYTGTVIDWIAFNLPIEIPKPISSGQGVHSAEWWTGVYELSYHLSSWIPKMCLALAIKDVKSDPETKKRKQMQSCRVAVCQINIVERVLLNALAEDDPLAAATTLGCIWTPPVQSDDGAQSSFGDAGIMSCLEHLSGAGIYLDPFESLKVQSAIMQLLVRVTDVANAAAKRCGVSESQISLLGQLVDCGAIRAMLRFLTTAFDIISNVGRLGLMSAYGKEYQSLLNSMRVVWDCVVKCSNFQVQEEIIESAFLQRLVEQYLPSTVVLDVPLQDAEYVPMVIRNEAIHMLRTLALHRPASERLIDEIAHCFQTALTVNREVTTLCARSSAKGKSMSKRLSAETLALLGMLHLESVDRALLDAEVPKVLLFVSATFSCLNPAVLDCWSRWGVKAGETVAASKLAPSEAAEMYEQGVEQDTYDAAADALASTAPELGKGNAQASSLLDWHEKKGKPLSATDSKILARKAELYEKKTPEMNYHANDAAVHMQDAKSESAFDEHDKAAVRVSSTHAAEANISLVLDRMGHLVLAVKGAFDRRKSSAGLISGADATEVLLELSLKGAALGAATSAITATLDYNGGHGLLDFPAFLQHYANVCGLSHIKSTAAGAGTGTAAAPLYWVPTRSGMWTEVDPVSVDKLHKAASPYQTSNDSVSVIEPESKTVPTLGRDLWVRTDDVTDILMLVGVEQSEVHTAETVRSIRRFLPGMATGKLSFHELLCIYIAVRDNPQGDGGLGRSSMSIGRDKGDSTRSFSRPLKPQHGNTAAFSDPFHGGVDESVYPSDRMTSGVTAKGKTPKSSVGDSWSLPFRATCVQVPKSTISAEFRRLDLRGEGRLNFLGLKAALELREVHLDDALIRQWLKESDRGGKGYVTYDDYETIYNEAQGGQMPVGIGISREHQRYGTLDAGAGVTRSSALAKQAASTMPISSEASRQINAERRALLKRAFAKYDVDKDGFISVEDLRRAFAAQGRETPQTELVAWVRRRDLSGIGAVCIEDFLQSYSQNE